MFKLSIWIWTCEKEKLEKIEHLKKKKTLQSELNMKVNFS